MRARLKCVYAGPAGSYNAGTIVTSNQIPGLQDLIDAGYAVEIGIEKIERAVVAPPETADIKLKTDVVAPPQPVHKGSGYYLMPDGSTVRGKKAAGLV